MKRNVLVIVMLLCGCVQTEGQTQENLIASFDADTLPPLASLGECQPGVTTSLNPTTRSLRITSGNDDAVEAMLYPVELSDIENCVLWYEANLKFEGAKSTSKAYLVMWITFPDGKSYFSRAVDQALTGTTPGRLCKTPFFLKRGEAPISARLGVRFEGPGSAFLSNARLVKRPLSGFGEDTNHGGLNGIILGLSGALFGIWGGIAGSLSARGKARKFVFATGIVFLTMTVGCLVAGLGCLAYGGPRELSYPLLLAGGLGTPLLLVLLQLAMRRYRQIEGQRLAIRDQAESL
jgi:hypothetical protein